MKRNEKTRVLLRRRVKTACADASIIFELKRQENSAISENDCVELPGSLCKLLESRAKMESWDEYLERNGAFGRYVPTEGFLFL